MPETDCAIIILAAGSSSRLGEPKQLLMLENKTLLAHAIEAATTSGIGETMVVTGAGHDKIVSVLPVGTVQFIYNENWQQGMANSLRVGLSALVTSNPALLSVLIMLCDQPFVSSLLLQEMMTQKEATGKGIIACEYNDSVGVPALFSYTYFADLLSLQGTEGAKKIIAANADDVTIIPFPKGAIDIDTKEDYERLIK